MAVILGLGVALASDAKGTLKYENKGKTLTAELKNAYLVKGPDDVDRTKITRRLIFSSKDIGDAIQECTFVSCAENILLGGLPGLAGLVVDLDTSDVGPNFRFLVRFNDSEDQSDGYEKLTALKATTDTATRLTGKLAFVNVRDPLPVHALEQVVTVDVDFDAPLFKEFDK